MSVDAKGRAILGKLFTPVARGLLKIGIGPDAVTIAGTVCVATAALWLLPTGRLLLGALIIAVFVFTDSLDGTMARLKGREGLWGAYLDSTLDRVADAAIFAGIALWYFGRGDDWTTACLALACLVGALLISYSRARAEGLGYVGKVGIAERSQRLAVVGVALLAAGFGAPAWVVTALLAVLAVFEAITIVQRAVSVHRQDREAVEAARTARGDGASDPERGR